MTAPGVRLDGRVDLLERGQGTFTIRDLKTGRVDDGDGQLRPDIALQLRLYGIAVKDLVRDAKIRLVVDHQEELEVPFDAEVEASTRRWLEDVMLAMPADREVAAAALADPGPSCRTCSYRHACMAYQRLAPTWWRSETAFPIPHDIAGVVRSIDRTGELRSVLLTDMAGRTVRVHRVDEGRLNGMVPGDRVWIFGLLSQDRTHPERWRHPLNFYHVGDDPVRQRAWSLRIQLERGDQADAGTKRTVNAGEEIRDSS